MATNIGPKIGIDGEAQFRSEIKKIGQSIKTLGSEMKVVTAEYYGNEKSAEALTKKNEILERRIYTLKDQLKLQNKMLAESVDKYKENSYETMKWHEIVNQTTAELKKAEGQIRENTQAIDDLNNEQGEASEGSNIFKDALGELGISMSTLTLAGVVGAAIAGLKELIGFFTEATTNATEFADSILTIATNYGISTEKLQEFQYMSDLVDADINDLMRGITNITKSMGSAMSGSTETLTMFQSLGVAIAGADGHARDAVDVFWDVVDALGNVENATERDIVAQKLLGKSSMELNSLIAVGAERRRELAEESHNVGYVLSEEELAVLGALDDQFKRIDLSMEAVKNRMALQLAPALIEITDAILEMIKEINWEEFGRSVAILLNSVARNIGPIAEGVSNLVIALGNLLKVIGDISEIWEEIYRSPLGLLLSPLNADNFWKGATGNIFSLIPGFANGGVFEPNRPQLAVLGDNTTEREIVAPRSEMIDATLEALRISGGRGQNINIQFTGNLAQLGRILQPVVSSDATRIGSVL